MEYGEITAIRRSARLVHDSGKTNMSCLTGLVYIVLVLLVMAAFAAILG